MQSVLGWIKLAAMILGLGLLSQAGYFPGAVGFFFVGALLLLNGLMMGFVQWVHHKQPDPLEAGIRISSARWRLPKGLRNVVDRPRLVDYTSVFGVYNVFGFLFGVLALLLAVGLALTWPPFGPVLAAGQICVVLSYGALMLARVRRRWRMLVGDGRPVSNSTQELAEYLGPLGFGLTIYGLDLFGPLENWIILGALFGLVCGRFFQNRRRSVRPDVHLWLAREGVVEEIEGEVVLFPWDRIKGYSVVEKRGLPMLYLDLEADQGEAFLFVGSGGFGPSRVPWRVERSERLRILNRPRLVYTELALNVPLGHVLRVLRGLARDSFDLYQLPSVLDDAPAIDLGVLLADRSVSQPIIHEP